jgi:RND family efflux transporter MFP subunit
MPELRRNTVRWLGAGALLIVAAAAALWTLPRHDVAPPAAAKAGAATGPAAAPTASGAKSAPGVRPALTVTLATLQRDDWPRTLGARGNIAAWQEAAVGAELAGYRLTEVLVNVGDVVRKGQTLARINAETVEADRAQVRAAVAEAEAVLAEAKTNAARSRDLAEKGFISPQAATQTATLEQTAAARLAAVRAKLQAEEVRLAQTRVVAPDDGTISTRAATIGAQTQPGQELFRLIRGNRLEWRAEVPEAELGSVVPGMPATVRLPSGAEIRGTVRTVAPTVDPLTRNAIVYVDLQANPASAARAGMFARGDFDLGRTSALWLPQTAVVQRDGFSYVFRVDADHRVAQTKVAVGRRTGERVEITGGLEPQMAVVASGAGFLADGDPVRVVDAKPTPAKP